MGFPVSSQLIHILEEKDNEIKRKSLCTTPKSKRTKVDTGNDYAPGAY